MPCDYSNYPEDWPEIRVSIWSVPETGASSVECRTTP